MHPLSTALLLLLGAAQVPAGPPLQTRANSCWLRGNPAQVSRRASPHDSAMLALGGDTITVCYARPARRGREVMGGLVPYGEPWRLGANEATAIHVPFAARIAGVAVEPGWYSLYAVPQASQWRIVVNREVRRWGIPIDSTVRARDVGSGVVRAERVAQPVEALTITLRPDSSSAAVMVIEWEQTRVRVPIERR